MLWISCVVNLCKGDQARIEFRMQNVVDGQYRGKTACMLNVSPQVPDRRWSPRIGQCPHRRTEGPEGVAEGHRMSAALVGKAPLSVFPPMSASNAGHCFTAASAPVVDLLCFCLCRKDCLHLVVVS
jgi:hypothetical protein